MQSPLDLLEENLTPSTECSILPFSERLKKTDYEAWLDLTTLGDTINLPESIKLVKLEPKQLHLEFNDKEIDTNVGIPVLQLTIKELIDLGTRIIHRVTGSTFNEQLTHYLVMKVAEMYNPVSYHNFSHGFSLMLFWHQSLCLWPALKSTLSSEELFVSYVAGLAHDNGHFGTNNAYQVKINSQRSIGSKGVSVLEKMHISRFFTLLRREEKLAPLQKVFSEERKKQLFIDLILSTDMAHHAPSFAKLQKVKLTQEQHSDEQYKLMLEQLFHACDISNACLPYNNYISWSGLLTYEFDRQVKKEKANNVVISPFFEFVSLQSFYIGQQTFIKMFVMPLWEELDILCGHKMAHFIANLKHNIDKLMNAQDKEKMLKAIKDEKNEHKC